MQKILTRCKGNEQYLEHYPACRKVESGRVGVFEQEFSYGVPSSVFSPVATLDFTQ